jgi:aminopeptidase N
MADARTIPEQPPSPQHAATRREDYRPPDWLVPEITLDFALDPAVTRVRATLSVIRNGAHDRPLRLNGDGLTPLRVSVDGGDARWSSRFQVTARRSRPKSRSSQPPIPS